MVIMMGGIGNVAAAFVAIPFVLRVWIVNFVHVNALAVALRQLRFNAHQLLEVVGG